MQAKASERAAQNPGSDSERNPRQASPMTSILLVDDYPANLAALEAILEPLGCRLIKASSGKQAIELLAREEVAVVLMDVRMPGLDGFKTAELMRSRWRAKSTPVIFLTAADTDTAAILDGYARGAADFLVRPYEPEILRSKVAVFVDLYLKERTIREQAAALRYQERADLERKSDLRFRKMMDAMPLCVLVTDGAGRPVYWNQSAFGYTGIAQEAMASRDSFIALVHPGDRETLVRQWDESIGSQAHFEVKFRIRGLDGGFKWHLGRGIPQRDEAEGVTGWILTATDIETENQALLEAEAANRIKDEFLATVSHELRNPLNAIMGWVHLLHSGSLDSVGSKRALETIERNVHLQVSLIDEILDLSRIARGKVHLTLRTVNLVPLLASALDVIRPAADAKEIAVEWKKSEARVFINGDSERLNQVISNLLSNALKFTPDGGRISVSLERHGHEATISVSDTGKGIEPEFLPFVFDMFRQADSSITREHHGLGLGLAVARKLVELHGGRINAESAGAGKGARFSVTLPLQASQVAPEAPTQSGLSDADSVSLEGIKILVVEDHPDSRDALAHLLGRLGARTSTAGSVKEGLGAVSAEMPDVLISDLAMPGQDGYALIKALNDRFGKRRRKFFAIALTGLSDPQHSRRALNEGFDVCMVKPLNLNCLVECVVSAVRRSGDS
jgi:PAS domain S-box-containing protein